MHSQSRSEGTWKTGITLGSRYKRFWSIDKLIKRADSSIHCFIIALRDVNTYYAPWLMKLLIIKFVGGRGWFLILSNRASSVRSEKKQEYSKKLDIHTWEIQMVKIVETRASVRSCEATHLTQTRSAHHGRRAILDTVETSGRDLRQ